jgi:Mlc titration factor MtfA (ptsG expression regulator)
MPTRNTYAAHRAHARWRAEWLAHLAPRITRREWLAAMQPARDNLAHAIKRGRETLTDPYAARTVDEFFCSRQRTAFSDPATPRHAAPAVATLFERFDGSHAVAVAASGR